MSCTWEDIENGYIPRAGESVVRRYEIKEYYDLLNEDVPMYNYPKDRVEEMTKQDRKDWKQKADIALVPAEAIEALAKVMHFGAISKGYTRDNWMHCEKEDTHKYYSAAMRHLLEVKKGNLIDPESGLTHISHAMCNLAFMEWFYNKNRLGKI